MRTWIASPRCWEDHGSLCGRLLHVVHPPALESWITLLGFSTTGLRHVVLTLFTLEDGQPMKRSVELMLLMMLFEEQGVGRNTVAAS